MLLTAPVTIVGGKGGVGKSSVAAALALASADAGRRTLLLSTDPAHSLGDVLDVALGDRPTPVVPGLTALEPDADATAQARVRQVEQDAAGVLPAAIMPAVRRHLRLAVSGPGTRESALADRFVATLEELGTRWDHIVVDSAPTGHLLQLLAAPAALADQVAALAARRRRARAADPDPGQVLAGREPAEDPLLATLEQRRQRLEHAAALLRDAAVVRLVCTPRRVVVAETLRAATALRAAGLRLGPTVLNHLVTVRDPAVVADLEQAVGPLVVAPAADEEPIGPDALRRWWARATPATDA